MQSQEDKRLERRQDKFQYRKRYKGACNRELTDPTNALDLWFQYRKRYKGACNTFEAFSLPLAFPCFNTVNGIRVHAIPSFGGRRRRHHGSFNTVNGIRVHAIRSGMPALQLILFQYRKRYKGACNSDGSSRM